MAEDTGSNYGWLPLGLGALGGLGIGMYGNSQANDAANQSNQAWQQGYSDTANIYNQEQRRNAPYAQMGYQSLAGLRSAIYGGPQSVVGVDPVSGQPTMYGADFKPGDSPAAQYEWEQGSKQLNRSLAARGMAGGANAANRLSEMKRGIAASDWQNQYQRLIDSINVARGFQVSPQPMYNAAQNKAQGLANTAQNGYNNGMSSLYGGLAGGVGLMNSFMNFQKNGGFSGIGDWFSGNGNGDLYNDAGGDINNVDFGSDWGTWSDGSAA